MVNRDPVRRDDIRYGCRECQYTTTARTHQSTCPDCGSRIELTVLSED